METLAERLLQALRQRGATEVFGIPGDFALPLFREFERSRPSCRSTPCRTSRRWASPPTPRHARAAGSALRR